MLEDLNVYHPYSGVTNNQSESFNATLKRLQRWREVPIDTIVLSLYHLQGLRFRGDWLVLSACMLHGIAFTGSCIQVLGTTI